MPGDGEKRLSFERDAESYTLGRPGYPARVFEFLEELGALRPATEILELGPGTGQATGELLARGGCVTAVELGANLAATLSQRLPDPALTVLVGDIHTMALPQSAYDLVAAATMFHWLDSSLVLPRVAASLRADGWLAVWWTVFGDPSEQTPFRRLAKRIYEERLPSEPRMEAIPRPLRIKDRVEELTSGGLFDEPVVEVIRWNAILTAADVRGLFATFPNVAALPADRRDGLLTALAEAAVLAGEPVSDPFVTVVYAARVSRADAVGA